MRALEKELKSARAEIDKLEKKIEMRGKGTISTYEAQKLEKQIKDMTKRVDLYKTQDQKRGRELSALQEEKAALEKKASALETELRALKQELAEAKAAAAESIALQEEHKAVKTEAKKLRSENKTLQENFESERRQRKKLYNKLEEMKGKIRVFCRVRPMSSSETQRGSVNIVA